MSAKALLLLLGGWYLVNKEGAGGLLTETGSSIPFEALAKAIQYHEGWYEGSRSWRNNNPGNLRYAGQMKAIGMDNQGFAIFATYGDGFDALIAQLKLDALRHPEWTLVDFLSNYAPSSDGNNVSAYVSSVVDSLRKSGYQVSSSTSLGEFA